MGISSAIAGIGGALGGLFGGNSASNVQLPPQLPNVTQSANAGYAGIQGLGQYSNAGAGTLNNSAGTYNNLYNNPYAGLAQSGANTAGTMGMNAANTAYGAGGAVTNAGIGLLPGASAIMTAGFDPQSALYNQTLSQVQNQANAQNVASGLSMTPYGASVAGADTGNFNIGWQNQQLGREAQAAGAASGLVGAAGGAATTGAGLQSGATSLYGASAAMPYTAANTIGQNQNQATSQYLGNVGTAQNISQQQVADYLQYMQTAGGQNLSQSQLALQQQQQGFNQNQQFGTALGAGLYGLGNATGLTGSGGLNSFFGGGGGNAFANQFNSAAYGLGGGAGGGSEAALAGLQSGMRYNPLTGSIG